MPVWSELRDAARLEAGVRRIVVDLDTARMRAVANNLEHRIVFTVGSGRYVAERHDGIAYRASGPPIDLPDGISVVACSAPDTEIRYTPRGSAASFGTIIVQGSNGSERRVIVSITGRVRTSGG